MKKKAKSLLIIFNLFFLLQVARSQDSLIKHVAVSGKNDEVMHKKTDQDKNSLSKEMKKIIPYGNIAVGTDYGFLPYTINAPAPATAITTQGQLGIDLFNIPLDITYFYTTQKNLIGLNNYFRISYNVERYKDKMNGKLSQDAVNYKSQLGPLYTQRQQMAQKMAYLDHIANISPDHWPQIEDSKVKDLNPESAVQDTLEKYKSKQELPNIQKPNFSDSLNKKAPDLNLPDKILSDQRKIDSVKTLYQDYKSKYDNINDSIGKIQKRIDQIETVTKANPQAYSKDNILFNKVQNLMSGVQKFEIGLCYPNHSMFLVNNVPVRGLNFEYAKNNRFLAFTYGTTVSTLLYNNRSADGFLQNVRNSYNYFDFNNLSAGRKIIAVKFGTGTKEGNHIFGGVLYGQGQTSYLGNPETQGTISRESNIVVELDGKYKLKPNTTLDLIVGKSSLMNGVIQPGIVNDALNEIFSKYCSFAAMTKISTKIKPTNTFLSFSTRWVDPFFKSYGIGFIRSDNLRYEIRCDQPLGKKLRYTGMFRYEEDNLLRLMNYKNTFYSVNNTVSLKVRRGLMLRASYTPLFRTLRAEGYSFSNRNSITTGVISYNARIKKVTTQFNILYSYYIVNTDSQQLNFKNFSYTHQLSFKKGFKTSLNVSWFKNNLKDTLNNNVFLGILDAGYQFKNATTITLAGKAAYKINGNFYPGFIAKINFKLYRTLFWENHFEKFIVGDLFNGYNLDNLKRFPYYYSTKLVYNF